MSVKREEVRELLPVGERVWVQCDGCGKKSEVSQRGLDDDEIRRPRTKPNPFRMNPPLGWITVVTPYDVVNDKPGEAAHACERCKDMPASRLLEMAGIEE